MRGPLYIAFLILKDLKKCPEAQNPSPMCPTYSNRATSPDDIYLHRAKPDFTAVSQSSHADRHAGIIKLRSELVQLEIAVSFIIYLAIRNSQLPFYSKKLRRAD